MWRRTVGCGVRSSGYGAAAVAGLSLDRFAVRSAVPACSTGCPIPVAPVPRRGHLTFSSVIMPVAMW